MISIVISIRPEWVAKILKGEKTLEIRKTAPKRDLPIDVYIYCTKGDYIGHLSNKYVGKIVARFTLEKVEEIFWDKLPFPEDDVYCPRTNSLDHWHLNEATRLDDEQLEGYIKEGTGYALYISNLEIFDKPKDLADYGLKRAPQSWCYAKEGGANEEN